MAKQSISKSQLHFIQNGGVADIGELKSSQIMFKDFANTLEYLAGQFALKIRENQIASGAVGTGKGADNIVVGDVVMMGNAYEVSLSLPAYLEFVNSGVDGWAKSKGGKYKFKTKGTPDSMVESIKKWIVAKGLVRRIATQTTRTQIKDSALAQAKTTAFMIKRMGIKPRHFIDKAKQDVMKIAEQELGQAIKVDIINNLTS